MRLFAIGDLHLSGGDDKPMDVFGPQWDRHFLRIQENWQRLVSDEDTVLIPGDISWAMQLQDARADLEQIACLPGKKILCKGNHDYWWNSISQVRSVLPAGMKALQHSAADLGDAVVCGTRGWLIPTNEMPLNEQNEKICRREAERLRLALEEAALLPFTVSSVFMRNRATSGGQRPGPSSLPGVHPPSSLPSSLPCSLLRIHLRKQSRAGQVRPTRGQAVGEGKRLATAFCLAVRSQGDRAQILEPAITPCS